MTTKIEMPYGVIGLPPSTYLSDDEILNSMPIAEITPGTPSQGGSLTTFNVFDNFTSYQNLVRASGFEIQAPLRVAFLADNFPTDSFTNEYGESFLQKVTDVSSEAMQQIAQMTGARTATEGTARIGEMLGGVGQEVGGAAGSLISGVGEGAVSAARGIESLIANLQRGGRTAQFFGGGAQILSRLLAGNRVDFPQIWRNSGYSAQYTFTIRLYNPNPRSDTATEKYILGPLTALLCLAVPVSLDGKTYGWPYFHRVESPGILNLRPAVITNITVVKGGDQQSVAFNQRLSIVDVRIDWTSLFATMLAETGKFSNKRRPTVKNYIEALRTKKNVYGRSLLNTNAANRAGVLNSDGSLLTTQSSIINEELENPEISKRVAQTPTTPETTSRVPSSKQSTSSTLSEANESAGFAPF